MKKLFDRVAGSLWRKDPVNADQEIRFYKNDLPLCRDALCRIAQMSGTEKIGLRRKACLGWKRAGDFCPLPCGAIPGKIGFVHPEGVVRRRRFEPCAFSTFYIGVPACIRKHRLAMMPHMRNLFRT